MMSTTLNRLMAAVALASSLIGSVASADTLITNFDNFNFGGTVAAWADTNVTTLTSNPTNYQVESTGFGFGFKDITPVANGSGETMVEFDMTVNSGGPMDVLAVLEDGDTSQIAYRWTNVGNGNHVLRQPLTVGNAGSLPGGINFDSFQGGGGASPD